MKRLMGMLVVMVTAAASAVGFLASAAEAPTPNDPRFPDQWWLHNIGQDVKMYADSEGRPIRLKEDFDIDAPEGWAMLKPQHQRRKIRVAIVSSGIDLDHPDLNQNGKVVRCAGSTSGAGIPIEGYCQDLYGTVGGTFTAGIIAAERDNGVGAAGIAPEVELAIFKAFNDLGAPTSYLDYYAGLAWVTDPDVAADIIVLPFGNPLCGPDDKERALLEAAHDRGVLIVSEAGERNCVDNDDGGPLPPREGITEGGDYPVYPSSYDFVLSAGGTAGTGKVWARSTCNSTVDILAPALAIWSTDVTEYGVFPYPDGTPSDGTTFIDEDTGHAAAIVAGVAALVMSQENLTTAEVVERLITTVSPVNPDPSRPEACTGLGQVNLASALRDLPEVANPKAKEATRKNPR